VQDEILDSRDPSEDDDGRLDEDEPEELVLQQRELLLERSVALLQ
jgi:hypothetical protein